MTDFIETIGLHAEGFTDQQIAQINAELPDAQALIALVKANLPAITRLITVLQMAVAVFEQHQKDIGS
jgi:ABC-type transporter Mla subunit MlaD